MKHFIWVLTNVLYLCDAIILVKFGRVSTYYRKNMEKNYQGFDPLESLKLLGRQLLCDAVINAKQFMGVNHPKYYENKIRGPAINLTKFDFSESFGDRLAQLNYQRWYASSHDANLMSLKYRYRFVKAGGNFNKEIRSIQCVNTEKAKWFVTFGGIDKYMYLLEPGMNKYHSKLRVTGLFEPSALIDSPDFQYFSDQIQNSRVKMESVCKLGFEDRVRLCGAIYDVLSSEGTLGNDVEQTNYLRHDQRCRMETVDANGEKIGVHALPCKFKADDFQWEPFHVLADTSVRGAAFLLFRKSNGELELNARITKLGALLNPVPPMEKRKQQNVDNEPTKISKKRKRRRLYKDQDYISEEDEENSGEKSKFCTLERRGRRSKKFRITSP